MKSYTLQPREILAWIVLACAVVLFGVTVSYAQDEKSKDKSEIRIKIQKDEDGKKIRIDTTITADQLPAMKEYLRGMNIDFDADEHGSGNANIFIRHSGKNGEDQEAFEKDMEKLNVEMKGLDKELKEMQIEIDGSDKQDPEHYDWHFSMPPMPPSSELSEEKRRDGENHPGAEHFNFMFHSSNNEVPDSLNDDDHIVLYGSKGEDKPVFEKEITTSDGDKIFVFRRKLPKEESPVTSSLAIAKVKVYPNPGNGKISVGFTASARGDVEITITDEKGKTVFSKTIKNFSGEYFNQVDISDKGKGTYFLKITQGDDSVTKKLLVE